MTDPEELASALRELLDVYFLADNIYHVRADLDDEEEEWFGANPGISSWDHPKVKRYSELMELLERHADHRETIEGHLRFVEVSTLSDDTRKAWRIKTPFMASDEAAWLFFRLRETPDSAERFPKGKWASIQYFESLIQAQAKAAAL